MKFYLDLGICKISRSFLFPAKRWRYFGWLRSWNRSTGRWNDPEKSKEVFRRGNVGVYCEKVFCEVFHHWILRFDPRKYLSVPVSITFLLLWDILDNNSQKPNILVVYQRLIEVVGTFRLQILRSWAKIFHIWGLVSIVFTFIYKC